MNRGKVNQGGQIGEFNIRRWGVRLVVVLLLLALGWQFYWSNNLVTVGRELGSLREQSASLQEENLRLGREVAELESLERVVARAEELGIVSGGKIMVIRAGREMALANN